MESLEKETSYALFVYDGSDFLQPVSNLTGIPIDQINYLSCQIFALIFGYFYRTTFGPHNVSATNRHLIQLVVGLSLTYFCYGSQILHLFIQTGACYVLFFALRPGQMVKGVFLISLGYLSFCHIYRVWFDWGGWKLDITGPLMVNTQKLTCLAFSVRDGHVKDESKLSPTMKYHATKKWPRFLEFASYIFCFSTVILGPFAFYKDYIKFIEGTNFDDNKKDDDSATPGEPLSPMVPLLRSLAWTLVCGLIMFTLLPRYPIQYMMDPGFEKMPFLQKNAYMVLCTTLMRYKYYFAWMLAESVNLSSGLGYNGRTKDGKPRWDLLCNAGIVNVELCTSLKILLDNWNKTTTYWLRYVVYERVHSTSAAFFVSAFWHGFYSGYYVTFMSGAIFINAGRLVRRKIRPLFQTSPSLALFYDCVTFLATRLAISYLVFPFVLMEIPQIFRVYAGMYFWYHICVVSVLVFFPYLPLKSVRTSETATATNTATPTTTAAAAAEATTENKSEEKKEL